MTLNWSLQDGAKVHLIGPSVAKDAHPVFQFGVSICDLSRINQWPPSALSDVRVVLL